jgi:HemY protein
MIRILLFLAVLAALALGFSWIADQPGGLALTVAGYRYETSLVAALGFGLLALVAAMMAWSLVRFVFRIPTLMSLASRMRRRNKGFAALTRGMMAAGAGDIKAAAKAAREAERLIGEEPLTLLLAAQSAQLSGDRARATRLFQRMIEQSKGVESAAMRLLGLRGLHVEALRRGDDEAAYEYARLAHESAPAAWAGQAMLERCDMADDWAGALAVVETNAARKTIDAATARRQRAVLKTAIALRLQDRDPVEALALAREAIRLAPGLVPASALAGQLLARKGDLRRASKLLERAWRAAPHPDLARAYIDVRQGDSASDRLARAKVLARLAPGESESALVLARAALEARDFRLARQAMSDVFNNGRRPTARMCLTMADIEETEHGPSGRMREWLARAARAARDPVWIADGIVSDEWLPASPLNGRLDAFKWEVPVERIGHRQDEAAPPILSPIVPEFASATGADDLAPLELTASAPVVVQQEILGVVEGAKSEPERAPEPAGLVADAVAEPAVQKAVVAEPAEAAKTEAAKTEAAVEVKPAAGQAPAQALASVPAAAPVQLVAAPVKSGTEPLRLKASSPTRPARDVCTALPKGLVTAPDDPGPDAPDPLNPPPQVR